MAVLSAFARGFLATVRDLCRALFAIAFIAKSFVFSVVLYAVAMVLRHSGLLKRCQF